MKSCKDFLLYLFLLLLLLPYPRLDCNNTGCSERVQRCMYTNITLWIRSVIVICDFDGGSGICIEKIRHTFPLHQVFVEHLLVKRKACHYLVLNHWELVGYQKKNLFVHQLFIYFLYLKLNRF